MKRFFLPLVIFLGFFLRIVSLSNIPSGFTPDEASFGYDAYSILKTGKDQWGKAAPVLFESFGDFKSPVYGYLTVPSVAVFGLNKFSTRLPGAIFGTLGILVTYLLVKEIFKTKKKYANSEIIALCAAFLLSVSPWHLGLSRGAFEANLTTFFLPTGIYLFLRGLENSKFLIWSTFVFGLNLFTYHSAKVVTPLVLITLTLLYKKELFKNLNKKVFICSSLIFSVFLITTIYSFSLGAGRRAADINIYNGSLNQAFDQREGLIRLGINKTLAHLIYNKYTITLKRFYINYTSYFSPRFLFVKGPGEATYGMVPGHGVLYFVESIFLFYFIFLLIKSRKKEYVFILLWILFAPVPASLTSGVGYAANRVAVMMPAIQIAIAIGIATFLQSVSKIKTNLKYSLLIVLSLFVVFGPVYFLRHYFLNSNSLFSKQMLFGNLDAMDYLSKNYPDKKIIISTSLSEPQIYWAFATKLEPHAFQSSVKDWDYKERNLSFLDQLPEYKLNGVVFKRIDWKKDPKNADIILGRPDDFPKGVLVTKVFYYLDSTAALYLIDTKNELYAKAN